MAAKLWLLSSVVGAGAALAFSMDAPVDAQTARAQAHYAKVERELAAADTSALTPQQRTARTALVGTLRSYRLRGDFGRNTDFPGARVPYFVDAAGRRCAVAELMHGTGDDAVVARVARTANHAWIGDLADDPELRGWLGRNGLSLEEAARIQVPGSGEMLMALEAEARERAAFEANQRNSPQTGGPSGGSSGGQSGGQSGGSSGSSGSGGSSSAGKNGTSQGSSSPDGTREPSDGPSGTAGSSGSSGSSQTDGKSGGGGSGSGDSGAGAGGAPGRGASASGSGADAGSWSLWWEFAKLDFVDGRPLRLTVNGEAALAAKRLEAARTFTAALADPDPSIRANAAVALGRVAGEESVPQLVPLLDDSSRLVCERATLALGATASPAGAKVLVALAKDDRGTKSDLRALALVSLGLARRYGLDASFDADVAQLLEDAKKRDLADVGVAAFVHELLAKARELDQEALRAAVNPNSPDAARARAVETLGPRADDKRVASALRDLVGDRKIEVRRAAAVALGQSRDPLAVVQAQTAYELESEPLTRGFLLVSLGRKGGFKSLDFLREELAHGPEALRPWAALGLGVLARPHGDIEATAALRTADLPASARGALWIARGLARDPKAVPELAARLTSAQSPLERAHAATGLALAGGDEAHDALAKALPAEKSEYARVVIAWALGSMGRDADADAILTAVEGIEDVGMNGVAAVALGLHGSEACLDGALRRATTAPSPAGRAASIQAAGLLLSRSPGLVLHETSNRTNFAVMPRWLRSALGVTL